MRVSVIIPCFNHGRYIAETVASILEQTHEPAELIIVDDYSSDDSSACIADLAANDPRIKFIRHTWNRGASASRNDGLDALTGDYVAFCDADDLWMPDKLAIQLKLLEKNPHHDVVYSDAMIIDETGREKGQRFSELYVLPRNPSGIIFDALCVRNFVNMQTVLFRRKCLERNLRFDAGIKWVEDWWFWIQLAQDHPFLYVAQPLAKYRVHSRSTNVTHARGNDMNRYKVYKRILKTFATNLSPALKTQIWYHMAACLGSIGWARTARRFYQRSFATSLRHWRTIPRAIRPLARVFFG